MKRAFLASMFLILLPTVSTSQPPIGYIGLYADSLHTVNEISNPGGTLQFTMYIFCQPSELGMICAEFAIQYPQNIITGAVTENPGLSVYLGDLENGMSVCFYDCQWDWVWTFSQTLYLTDTEASRIRLVRHPEVGNIHFANCTPGYPTEAVHYYPYLCLNSACPADTDPPELIMAVARNTSVVRVYFTEPLFEATAEDTANYEVFASADPGNRVPKHSATLVDDGTAVKLSFAEPFSDGVSYTIRVSGVEDVGGNPIVPGSEVTFSGFDNVPPVLTGASAMDDSTVDAGFNERVTFYSAEIKDNYLVYRSEGGYVEAPLRAAVLLGDSMTVRLHLDTLLSGGGDFNLRVWNVTDLAGNVMPVSTVEFPVADNTPPDLLTATPTTAYQVRAVFNEPLDVISANDKSNYSLFETASPADTLGILSTGLLTDLMTARITLTDSLEYDVGYTLRVEGIKDLAGNAIDPFDEVTFIRQDLERPRLTGAVALNDTVLEVGFSEQVDSVTAEGASNYEVFRWTPFDSLPMMGDTLLVGGAVLQPDMAHVHLMLADTVDTSANHTILVSNVEDLHGNAIIPGSGITIYETMPPELVSVGAPDLGHLDVTFNEKLDSGTAEEETNYELFVTGDTASTIEITGADLLAGGTTVRLALGGEYLFDISYTLRVSNVEDRAENPIDPGSEMEFSVTDTYPPELLSAVILYGSQVDIVFNEQLDPVTAEDAGNYTLFELGGTPDSLPVPVLSAELVGDSTMVSLTAGDTLSDLLDYLLVVSNVEDRLGNPIVPESSFLIHESHPPELESVIATATDVIEVTFSEALDEETSEDVSNYELFLTSDTTVTFIILSAEYLVREHPPDSFKKVRLTLGGAISLGSSHTLRVSNVEDLAGNPIEQGSVIEFIPNDLYPPELVSAYAISATHISVVFSEAMDPATAALAENYTVFRTANPSSTVPVAVAVLTGGGTIVNLSLGAGLISGNSYTVRVSNVEDVAGNPIAPNSEAGFLYGMEHEGGYIGLYVDEYHSNSCVEGEGFYPVVMWIWCLPSENGQICAEFAVSYPANVIQSTVTENPIVSVKLGTLETGMSVCYVSCQYDWNWPFRQMLYVADSDATTIEIIKHPDPAVSAVQFANCLPGYPIEPVTVGSKLLINCSDHPPALLSAVALGDSLVSLSFSKELNQATAEDTANYEVFETVVPSNTVPVTAAGLKADGKTVILQLGDTLSLDVRYTVRVNNVQDTGGQTIPPNSEATFIPEGTGPPMLVSVYVSGTGELDVLFSDPLDETTAETVENYLLFVTAEPADSIPIDDAVLQGSQETVRLTLGIPLDYNTSYTLRVSNVENVYGIPMAPGSEISFITPVEEFDLYIYEQTGSMDIHHFSSNDSRIYEALGIPGPPAYGYDGWDFSTSGCEYFDIYFSDSLGTALGLQPGDALQEPAYLTIACTDLNCNNYEPDPPLHWAGAGNNLDAALVIFPMDSLWGVVNTRIEYGLCHEPFEAKTDRFASNALGPPDGLITMMGGGFSLITMRLGSTVPPPALDLAKALDRDDVLLKFSRPLDNVSAEAASNYSIYETASPSDSITVNGAALQPNEIDIVLSLGESLDWNTSYTVAVHNVEDTGGRPVPPSTEAEFAITDTVPPMLAGATRESNVLVSVVFSEPVDSVTASDPVHYELFELENPANTIGIQTAQRQADSITVHLNLAGTLDEATSYVLRVSDVEDRAGNPVPEGSEVILWDAVPPGIVELLVLAQDELEIIFNETLDSASAGSSEYYELFETADPSETIEVGDAELVDPAAVRLWLNGYISFGTEYTVRISDVMDRAGNPVAPGTEYQFTAQDTFPPVIVAAWRVSALSVDVQFSESVDSATAEDVSNYRIAQLGDQTDTLQIVGAERATDSIVVRLTLGDTIDAALDYLLQVSNVEDLHGNAIEPGSEWIIRESVPPVIAGVAVTDQFHIDVIFSEPVDSVTAEHAPSYVIHVWDDPAQTIDVLAAERQADSSTVRLSLGDVLNEGTTYRLHVTDVEDLSGNTVPPDTWIDFIISDTFPPELVTADAASATRVNCLFSEALDSLTAQDVSNYELFRTGDPSETYTITEATLMSSQRVELTLAEGLVSNLTYTVRVNNVEDTAGNPIAPDTEMSFFYYTGVGDGYMGLYVDIEHTENEVWYESGLTPFTLYVWCLPGEDGMMCAEFALDYSSNVIRSTVTVSPIVSVELGTLETGMSCCFSMCHYNWVWTHSQSCYLMDDEIGYVEVVPHPDVGVYQFANCLPGYPTEPTDLISKIYLNESEGPGPATMLLSHAASYSENGIEITWTLSRMDESVGFIVMRTEDGNDDFIDLSRVEIERNDLTFTCIDDEYEQGMTYRYRIDFTIGTERYTLFETGPVATPAIPLTLYQNWPNPFNPVTIISFYLPEAAHVVLEVYDVTGRLVTTLLDGFRERGRYEIDWDGTDLYGEPVTSGVYFYRIEACKTVRSRKMVLIR
ncbi:MAG: Ig-like domain-containing protein [bacterium]|nr:MAG: Ig-like domain-containing protein [bacterium]